MSRQQGLNGRAASNAGGASFGDTEGRTEIATAPAAASERTRPRERDRLPLTDEQRAIVEYGDGPLEVIAGAGTGKTRVIVERARWLLATKEDLLPEQVLVLTYNVKAARELRERIEEAVGPATAARMTVSNYHSFCHQLLTENGAEADMPPHPDVLDGIGQLLLLKDLRQQLGLVYHTEYAFPEFVKFINRCKDELVTPGDFDAYVAKERAVFEARYGSYPDAAARLATEGYLKPVRAVRGEYAKLRTLQHLDAPAEEQERAEHALQGAADRESRRTVGGEGAAFGKSHFKDEELAQVGDLKATYLADAAALDVMRLTELASVYHAYQDELARRGALDFGEQIGAVTHLFKQRPNLLRRYQRQYRYILVDEFQDANIAQIELIELLGRAPDRPDNVMVVGDDDQSIYRFRGASYAAFTEFDRRFSQPPPRDPGGQPAPARLRIEQNFRSPWHVLSAANRLIGQNAIRMEPDKRLRTEREDGLQVQVVVCGRRRSVHHRRSASLCSPCRRSADL